MWGEEGSHGFSQPNANDVYEGVSAEVLDRNQIFHDISWGQTRGQNLPKIQQQQKANGFQRSSKPDNKQVM